MKYIDEILKIYKILDGVEKRLDTSERSKRRAVHRLAILRISISTVFKYLEDTNKDYENK